ncbi:MULTISPECIES: three-helix bundle dimerization domain-containing protein [unclassified Mycobacteroides]|uniref:three-helix bundle dimerization domain-containing protein n=1 Tax=unclassified Mycobacteroides TaxID=2618759 RepID=UPI001EF117D8|nr:MULTISPECIES: hypothetical protein [unclassified Mycobacteroides]
MSEPAQITAVLQRLVAKYSWLTPEQIADVVQSAHAQFTGSRVREFVPLLVERRARAELTAFSASGSRAVEVAFGRLA